MISGYFLVQAQDRRLEKGIKLYALGAYLRIWQARVAIKPAIAILSAIGFVVLFVAGIDLYCIAAHIADSVGFYIEQLNRQNGLVFLVVALFLFIGFQQLRIRPRKWINSIAAATFGVYLLHDHYAVRSVLWERVIRVAAYRDSPLLIPYALAAVLLVFLSCLAVEWTRIHVPERLYMKPIRRMTAAAEEKIDRFFRSDA